MKIKKFVFPKAVLIGLKILGWLTGVILALLILIIVVIRIPAVQNKIVDKIEGTLRKQLDTTLSIGSVYLSFPKKIELNELYIEDKNRDTLAYVGEVSIDTDLFLLFQQEINLQQVAITDLVGNVLKTGEEEFNFSFIIDSLAAPSTADTTSSPWKFGIGDVITENIKISYIDQFEIAAFKAQWNTLEVYANAIDPINNLYDIDEINFENASLSYIDSSMAPSTEPQDSAVALPFVNVSSLSLSNITYNLYLPLIETNGRIGELAVTAEKTDIENINFDFQKITLENTDAYVKLPLDTTQQTTTTASVVPHITIASLALKNNSIAYHQGDRMQASPAPAFDPQHLLVANLDCDITDVFIADRYALTVDELSLKLNDDFVLRQLEGTFEYADTHFSAENGKIMTGNSSIKLESKATYPSIEEIADPSTAININIRPSNLHYTDIAYFYPEINQLLKSKIEKINFSAQASGTLNALNIDNVNIRLLDSTSLALNGKVKNALKKEIPDFSNVSLNFSTTRKNIHSILADSLLPANISLPETIQLTSALNTVRKGNQLKLNLISSLGNLTGNLLLSDSSGIYTYDANLNTPAMNVGKLLSLPNDNLDSLGAMVKIDGKGTTLSQLDLALDATIRRLRWNGYQYHDINAVASYQDSLLMATASIDDPNLQLDLNTALKAKTTLNDYKVDLRIDKAVLNALNLTNQPLLIKGTLNTDIQTNDFKKIDGDIAIRNFSAYNGIASYRMDSLVYASIDYDDTTTISLQSDILDGKFKGNITVTSIAEVLMRHVDQYYDFMEDQPASKVDSVMFTFDFNIKKTDLISEILFPSITKFQPGRFYGDFNSLTDNLQSSLSIYHVELGQIAFDSIALVLNSNPKGMNVNLGVDLIKNNRIKVHDLGFNIALSDDKMDTRLIVRDSLMKPKYRINALITSFDEGYAVVLDTDSLMLNYEYWSAPLDNKLTITNGVIETNDIVLANESQQIIFSKNNEADSMLTIDFKTVDLTTFGSAIDTANQILEGILNGTFSLSLPPASLALSADLNIDGFEYQSYPWGNVSVDLETDKVQTYIGEVSIKGKENKLDLSGKYNANTLPDGALYKASAEIVRFELNTLTPFLDEQVSSLSGLLTGKFNVSSDNNNIDMDGKLIVKNTSVNPKLLNNGLHIDEETIVMNNGKATFNSFKIKDNKNNSATIDGFVSMQTLGLLDLQLTLKTKNFMVFNTTAKDNDLFYGELRTDGIVRVSGTSIRPVLDVNLDISKGSNVTYVLPEVQYTALTHENTVVFINKNEEDSLVKETERAIDSLSFQGLKLSANIGVNDKSTLNIVIDPLTGDKLVAKGNAALSLDLNTKGDMELTGRYAITEGSYDFSFYKLVKRKFSVVKGSSITWTGDPLKANLDVTASHEVLAPAIDLISNQLSNATNQEIEQYKQRLTFFVLLDINGELMTPDIGFEIDMPEDQRGSFGGNIYARIQDLNSRESDLNKQVFALLILKRFIADNPLQGEAGYNLEDNARRSVSRILSDQLSRLTDQIGFVDLSVNLESYEDYSTGQAETNTQVDLGLSKTLLNDRLEVRVSGNVNLEGQEQQRFSDYVGDLVLEYAITPDGRFKATGFRRSDFDIVSGNIIETGAGVIYIKDYNTLKELFSSNDE